MQLQNSSEGVSQQFLTVSWSAHLFHIRRTLHSQHSPVKMFGFLPVSSTSQVNVVQMLVTLSRPTREARLSSQ